MGDVTHPAETLVMQALVLTARGEDEPVGDHLGRQAEAVVHTLIASGYMTDHDPQADLEQIARELAAKARHPRFSMVEDGWRQLLQSDQMVDFAHAQAVGKPGAQVPTLNGYRDILHNYHRHMRAHEPDRPHA